MNTRSVRDKFRNFRIILNCGNSSTIVMGKLTSKIRQKNRKITWETQAGKLMTANKVNVYFYLPAFSATKIVTWKCCVDESTNSRYGMVLGKYLITALGLYLKFSREESIDSEGPYEW